MPVPLVVSPERAELLALLADEVVALPADPFARVAVDGFDGAGKSVFADELAEAVRTRGREVVRASADDFLRPRAQRYARGRNDPAGFYRDSYDAWALRRELLDPSSSGDSGVHRTRVLDAASDTPVLTKAARAAPGTVLVVDGIFLHRPELSPAGAGRSGWTSTARPPCSAASRAIDRAHPIPTTPPTTATSKGSGRTCARWRRSSWPPAS